MTLRRWRVNPSKIFMRWTWHHPLLQTCMALQKPACISPVHHQAHFIVPSLWVLLSVLLPLWMLTGYLPNQSTLHLESWISTRHTMAGTKSAVYCLNWSPSLVIVHSFSNASTIISGVIISFLKKSRAICKKMHFLVQGFSTCGTKYLSSMTFV